ncbi:hypothetical protein DL771_009012 [Monosporascus sp. 5C6A]|nr:hypothetical protein DL771_009012 [Monosporascus sp. 5C6A]
MASSSAPEPRADPIRISKIAGRYLVFDIEDAMRLRRRHNMCGVFAGTIPQNPQQNVFMGLPMELLAEEALVLASRGVAYVVDDGAFHPARLASLTRSLRRSREGGGRVGGNDGSRDDDIDKDGDEDGDTQEAAAARAYLDDIRRERKKVEDDAAEQTRQARLRQAQHIKKAKAGKSPSSSKRNAQAVASEAEAGLDSLFDSPSADPTTSSSTPTKTTVTAVRVEPRQIWNITPTTSGALLTPPPEPSLSPSSLSPPTSQAAPRTIADAPSSWPLYAHLHARGYYMMPGLRFGCDYNVYPGDPLRFHSHFQATCYGWDEEIAMLDLVAGGRLGTNVKKGFLVGGVVSPECEDEDGDDDDGVKSGHWPDVRTFCIEWAGM